MNRQVQQLNDIINSQFSIFIETIKKKKTLLDPSEKPKTLLLIIILQYLDRFSDTRDASTTSGRLLQQTSIVHIIIDSGLCIGLDYNRLIVV